MGTPPIFSLDRAINMSRPDHQQSSPYLWATGSLATKFSPNNLVHNRYRVIAPQIWQDTQPDNPIYAPEELPALTIPYLVLFPHRLHLPVIYSVYQIPQGTILLLENAPFTPDGQLLPPLTDTWTQASPLRQVYWLWQILDLWQPLAQQGVAKSLIIPDNIRVEGWRIRLRELIKEPETTSLAELGQSWQSLLDQARPSLTTQMGEWIEQLQSPNPDLPKIQEKINHTLLTQAANQPLRIQVASASDMGVEPTLNEDSLYPTDSEVQDPVASHLAIVCDGIGGHAGGEVASQLAVQSLKLQGRAILAELTTDPELMSPPMVQDQLQAILRIVNNLIAAQNDEQGRESRQRMATTVMMALQLPQTVLPDLTNPTQNNSHEVYLAQVGDSRAYWLTAEGCHLLTVDHDVVTREVRMARSLYREALQRPDAAGLTQALGTREAEGLRPTIQRLMIEEDGLLLLCSDGLSDHGVVEAVWQEFTPQVLAGEMSLESAVALLMTKAKVVNPHDNISVVLTAYQVSPQASVLVKTAEVPIMTLAEEEQALEVHSSDSQARAIMSVSPTSEDSAPASEEIEPRQSPGLKPRNIVIGIITLVIVSLIGGLVAVQWLLPTPETPPEVPDNEEVL
jgi:protein phosphatase